MGVAFLHHAGRLTAFAGLPTISIESALESDEEKSGMHPRWAFRFAFVLLAGVVSASEELTNADVVELAKAGIGDAVIVAKVRTSAAAFDTSVDALLALSKEGVSDEVILAMVEAEADPTQGGAGEEESLEFGDDSSEWANDGECDDPRFQGDGMSGTLMDQDQARDATDCRKLFETGRIRVKESE